MARRPAPGGKGRKAPKDGEPAQDVLPLPGGRSARQRRPRPEPLDSAILEVIGELAELMDLGGLGPDLEVRVARLPHGQGLALPAYQSAGAAGLDLPAAVPAGAPLLIPPGGRALVPTGLVLEIEPGFEGQVRPRSGLALKHGVTVLNSPGTIDSDYRGEVQVLLVNLGEATFAVARGERIAQIVFAPVAKPALREVGRVSGTGRGAAGFGSTGTRTARGSRT